MVGVCVGDVGCRRRYRVVRFRYRYGRDDGVDYV